VYNTNQPEDGPTIGRKHVTGIIILYNLIKYEFVYDIYFVLYFSLHSTQRGCL